MAVRGEAAQVFHSFHSPVDKSLIGGMSQAEEKLRLREVCYQPLEVPASAAIVASEARTVSSRLCQCSMETPLYRDNGLRELIPLLGDKQEL
jgi:hypothetical protein